MTLAHQAPDPVIGGVVDTVRIDEGDDFAPCVAQTDISGSARIPALWRREKPNMWKFAGDQLSRAVIAAIDDDHFKRRAALRIERTEACFDRASRAIGCDDH